MVTITSKSVDGDDARDKMCYWTLTSIEEKDVCFIPVIDSPYSITEDVIVNQRLGRISAYWTLF